MADQYSKNLQGVIFQFVIERITFAIEKKLRKKREYREKEAKCNELEKQLLDSLTEEQKSIYLQFDELSTNLQCIQQEFIYKRGMLDMFRVKDIFAGSF